jgi:hypothetical protein
MKTSKEIQELYQLECAKLGDCEVNYLRSKQIILLKIQELQEEYQKVDEVQKALDELQKESAPVALANTDYK